VLDRLWLLFTMLAMGWLCVWVALGYERTQRRWWPFTMRIAAAETERIGDRPLARKGFQARKKINAFDPYPSALRNKSDGTS
jgi:hypothetical protein